MKFKQLFLSIAVMSLLSFAAGCGSGGGGGESSGGDGTTSGEKSGTLSLLLQDASSESYQAVYVTITEVQVCKGSNPNNDCDWLVAASPGKTYDLLKLVNGVREQLGITELEVGSYTQMRLIIGKTPGDGINLLGQPHDSANYVITDNAEIHELKIPSGFQTGIKIVHGFVIIGSETTELILDFDASKSVVRAGASGQWLLKPTIKVFETQEYSIVRGTVFQEKEAGSKLQGAMVSAQEIPNGNPEVIASTESGSNGEYALFIYPPGDYYIVGSKTGYDPACFPITTKAGETQSNMDIELGEPKATGKVRVTVSIPAGDPDPFVTLSFRRKVSCGSGGELFVEVKSETLYLGQNGILEYVETLTEGDYKVHASTANDFDEMPVTVTGGGEAPLAFNL